MKTRIELDSNIKEEEIVIRCRNVTDEIQRLYETLSNNTAMECSLTFYKGSAEYYLSLDEILFFETEEKVVFAHTKDDMYQVKCRLYELEEFLPGVFMRISKSTIINTSKVHSIQRNLTSSSLVEFQGTYKQVFASRHYYKALKNKLEEKRKPL